VDSIKSLFTAVGSVTGGRNGHGEAEDHSVSVNLSVPKVMGGPGRPNTTTPEHLFAVGYAACFGGALDFVAVQKATSEGNRNSQQSESCEYDRWHVGTVRHVVATEREAPADPPKHISRSRYPATCQPVSGCGEIDEVIALLADRKP
jgi:organic hydroperoxide reductase OsmC/OhrA